MNPVPFPMAGRTFEVDYGDITTTNAYALDGRSLAYEITGGALAFFTAPEGRFFRLEGCLRPFRAAGEH